MSRIIAIACPHCRAKTARVKAVAGSAERPCIARVCTNGDCLYVSRWQCEFLRFTDAKRMRFERREKLHDTQPWFKPLISTSQGNFTFTCGCGHPSIITKTWFVSEDVFVAYVYCKSQYCSCHFAALVSHQASGVTPLESQPPHPATKPYESPFHDPYKPVLRKPRGKG